MLLIPLAIGGAIAAVLAGLGGDAQASHLPDGASPELILQADANGAFITGDVVLDPAFVPNSPGATSFAGFIPPANGEVSFEFTAPDMPQADEASVTIMGVNARESQNGGEFIPIHEGLGATPPTGEILARTIRLAGTDPIRWRVDIRFVALPDGTQIEAFLRIRDNGGSATDNAERALPITFITRPPLDLAIRMTEFSETLGPGARITYTITVTNPEAVEQTVSLLDVHDTDTAVVPRPTPGEPGDTDAAWTTAPPNSVTAEVTVPAMDSITLTLVVLRNTVQIDADKHAFVNSVERVGSDFDNSNNFASVETPIIDLRVETTASNGADAGPGDLLLFRDTVTNLRDQDTPTTLTHFVPVGTTFNSASDAGWDCTALVEGGQVLCTRDLTLTAANTASGTQTFLLAVRIDADQLAGGELISDARVPAIGDLNGSDNRLELTTTVADNGSAPPTPEPDPIAIQERAVSFLNGFNYVVWTGPTMPVDGALLTFPNLGRLVVIFEFNAGAQRWDSFRQNFPANSISQLVSGRAYVFSMSGSAIWQMPLVVDLSGTQAVAVGFTLIGWVGRGWPAGRCAGRAGAGPERSGLPPLQCADAAVRGVPARHPGECAGDPGDQPV